MAGNEVLSLCKFSESQVQQFEELEKKMNEKWKLGLRWDSKVPNKDKWFLYFFTLKGLKKEKICQDLKDFEKKFRDINTEIQKIRGGRNIDPEHVQRIREKFEKVVSDMKYTHEVTNSSTLFNATRDALAEEQDIFRLFDNVEIVQSRKELQLKKSQLQDLEEEEEKKDQTIYTLQGLLSELLEKEPKQDEKIRELTDQIKYNKEKFTESSDAIMRLMRKLMYMPFNKSNSDPYEYGTEMQNLVELNLSMIYKLNELSIFLEGSRRRELQTESKIENLEHGLKICSEIFVSKDINALKDMMSDFLSAKKGSCSNDTSAKKGEEEAENNEQPSTASSSLAPSGDLKKFEEDSDDAVNDYLENQLTTSHTQSREMRYECSELMKLMAQMVLNATDGGSKINGIVIEVLLTLNKYMTKKLVAFVELLKVSRLKDNECDDTVENLENQLTVNLNQIAAEFNSMIFQMDLLL